MVRIFIRLFRTLRVKDEDEQQEQQTNNKEKVSITQSLQNYLVYSKLLIFIMARLA